MDRTLRVQQRKIINSVKHAKRENLELYGYTKDDVLFLLIRIIEDWQKPKKINVFIS